MMVKMFLSLQDRPLNKTITEVPEKQLAPKSKTVYIWSTGMLYTVYHDPVNTSETNKQLKKGHRKTINWYGHYQLITALLCYLDLDLSLDPDESEEEPDSESELDRDSDLAFRFSLSLTSSPSSSNLYLETSTSSSSCLEYQQQFKKIFRLS